MKELQRLLDEICNVGVIKVILSVSQSKQFKKAVFQLIKTPKETFFKVEKFTDKQAFHEKVSCNQLSDTLFNYLMYDFRHAQIITSEYVYGIKISSKGKVLHNRHKNTQAVNVQTTTDRVKRRIIDIENAPPVFFDLGIIDKDGKLINSHYSKYKQICRFVEFINDVVEKDTRDTYNIIDFGCGKSYLTFVVYHYMTKIMHKKVNICGLDLKQDVIDKCNLLARKYQYENLTFKCMDIKDYTPLQRPDMVIALHACDIATDYALYNAYRWQTDYIFSVPCCQHEFNYKVKTKNFGLLTDYGLIKERFCALATDAVRAKILEYCGYNTDILEFIDIEHSPKNVLIRAKRATRINVNARMQIKQFLDGFCREFNGDFALYRLVFSNNQEVTLNNKLFNVSTGKASMLLKDALTVRKEVFSNTDDVSSWALRDDLDDTSHFVNVYYENKPIATARLSNIDSGSATIGRIAVSQEFHSFGIGSFVLENLAKVAREHNVQNLVVKARQSATVFYEKNGFTVCDNQQSDFIKMIKKI